MKKIILSLTSFFIVAQASVAYASEMEYKVEKQSLTRVAAVVELGDKDEETNAKSPLLAGGLSFFIPGAGQIYNGEILKGILLFIGVVGLAVLDFTIIEPKNKTFDKLSDTEKLAQANSLFDVGTLATRISLPVLWVYGWGSAYQSADPVYQKKLKEEEKNKANTQNNISLYNSYNLNLFSYKF